MATHEEKDLELIKLRFALAFRKLLEENLAAKEEKGAPFNLVTNANQLADSVQMRPATITDILNAKSIPGGLTMHLMLEALGKTFVEFGKYYDSFTKTDISKFKTILSKKGEV